MRDGEVVHLEELIADSVNGKVLVDERPALIAASIAQFVVS